jgi:hypothetical protein
VGSEGWARDNRTYALLLVCRVHCGVDAVSDVSLHTPSPATKVTGAQLTVDGGHRNQVGFAICRIGRAGRAACMQPGSHLSAPGGNQPFGSMSGQAKAADIYLSRIVCRRRLQAWVGNMFSPTRWRPTAVIAQHSPSLPDISARPPARHLPISPGGRYRFRTTIG